MRDIDSVCRRAGERIRMWREEKGWSQEFVGNLPETGLVYVKAVERGVKYLPLVEYYAICTALGHTLAELFAEEEE